MTQRRYFGYFRTFQDVITAFWIDDSLIQDHDILFAYYGSGSYYGSAIVIFTQAGKLRIVEGSHCSCRGLEGQWNPGETSWEALAMRRFDFGDDTKQKEAQNTLKAMIRQHIPRA